MERTHRKDVNLMRPSDDGCRVRHGIPPCRVEVGSNMSMTQTRRDNLNAFGLFDKSTQSATSWVQALGADSGI